MGKQSDLFNSMVGQVKPIIVIEFLVNDSGELSKVIIKNNDDKVNLYSWTKDSITDFRIVSFDEFTELVRQHKVAFYETDDNGSVIRKYNNMETSFIRSNFLEDEFDSEFWDWENVRARSPYESDFELSANSDDVPVFIGRKGTFQTGRGALVHCWNKDCIKKAQSIDIEFDEHSSYLKINKIFANHIYFYAEPGFEVSQIDGLISFMERKYGIKLIIGE